MTNNANTANEAQATNAHDVVVEQPVVKRTVRKSIAVGFVAEHPVLVIAGGIAAGLVIGALIPRRSKKALVKRTSALSEIIGAAAVTFGREAANRADAAGMQVSKASHVLADRAEDWTAVALRSASAFAQSAAENMTRLSETAAEKAENFGEGAADQLGKAGHHASKRVSQAVPVAQAAAAHTGKRVGKAIAELRSRIVG